MTVHLPRHLRLQSGHLLLQGSDLESEPLDLLCHPLQLRDRLVPPVLRLPHPPVRLPLARRERLRQPRLMHGHRHLDLLPQRRRLVLRRLPPPLRLPQGLLQLPQAPLELQPEGPEGGVPLIACLLVDQQAPLLRDNPLLVRLPELLQQPRLPLPPHPLLVIPPAPHGVKLGLQGPNGVFQVSDAALGVPPLHVPLVAGGCELVLQLVAVPFGVGLVASQPRDLRLQGPCPCLSHL
mmetsp:Transcript_38815/g.93563  ORF Transcript_38815/g.93563 Transcript_38815/m.93563 type:complete len:236 (-) Transcript_38815:240-947(-)